MIISFSIFYENFLAKFKAKFEPDANGKDYIFYANEKAYGVPCSYVEYESYLCGFEMTLKKQFRLLRYITILCIPICTIIILLSELYKLPDSTAPVLILMALPVAYIMFKCISASRVPNQLYKHHIATTQPQRDQSKVMDYRLKGMSDELVWFILLLSVVSINLSLPLAESPQNSKYLWLYLGLFVSSVYIKVKKLHISIQECLDENEPQTFGNASVRHNSGCIKLMPVVWAMHHPFTTLTLSLTLISSLVLSIWSLWFIPVFVLVVQININYWVRKFELFANSELTPGLVVSVNPTLVAVACNLDRSDDLDCPVIKIIKYKSKSMLDIGDKIGSVVIYSDPIELSSKYCSDVTPIPINLAIDDEVEISIALASFSNKQWGFLYESLKKVKKPYEPGRYLIFD